MTPSPEHNLVSPEAIKLGYEPQRISIRALLILLVVFVASMVVLQALIWWLMRVIAGHDQAMDRPLSILKVDQQPPGPNLQPSVGHESFDYQDLEAARREEDQMFVRMGWQVDPATHRVSIPSEIVSRVAEHARAHAASAYVPPTTTGKNRNSIAPGAVPATEGGNPP